MSELVSGLATAAAKTELRGRLLTARRALSPQARQHSAVRLQAALTALVRELRPGLVASYLPMTTEPGGADLSEALATHAPLLLPVLRPDLDLDWAHFTDTSSLSNHSPMREPTGPRLGVDAIVDADLVVVPALAVDRTGVRLGRGGGSYDRALARVRRDTLLVTPLHDGELVSALPAEPHDVRVHAVVLPGAGVVRLSS